ncbi:MAG: iron-sulfur cluster loop [Chloroflexi bacterium]|nr:iron-sulfur cluster loop [Chloroflexota bacterium]
MGMLADKSEQLLAAPKKKIEFTKLQEADDLLNDLEKYPHTFVLGCIMDRQIKSERAWLIPYKISQEIGSFEFSRLISIGLDDLKKLFEANVLHRFNDIMARNFHLAVQTIHTRYKDDVSSIWTDNPPSAAIVRRFLEFQGVGIKIASMATNTLIRDFKIPVSDKLCVDISPDIHIKRVFTRLGLVREDASNDEIIYCAREWNPTYPGIVDLSTWEVGREWCRPHNPTCEACFLTDFCPKIEV